MSTQKTLPSFAHPDGTDICSGPWTIWHKAENNTLIHRGRVTHIYVGNLTTIDSDNGLSPDLCQAIISEPMLEYC